MLTMEDIRDYPLGRAAFGGYRAEDVENFRDEVLETFHRLFRDNQELIQKLRVLAGKVEQQQAEAEEIRMIMVRAQHDADNLRAEAGEQARVICEQAQAQADEMLAQAAGQADSIIRDTDGRITSGRDQLTQLQMEVSGFKKRLISIYREHIELITALPDYEEVGAAEPTEEPEQAEAAQEPEAAEPSGEDGEPEEAGEPEKRDEDGEQAE